MIRPAAIVYWNYLKGPVDEFGRAMRNLFYTNVGENMIVSIIGRLLYAQLNNSAGVHRLSLSRQKEKLPTGYEENSSKGYRELRKIVSKCSSFANYARQLDK